MVNQKGNVSGRYGYWVGDENQKARLLGDSYVGGTLSSAEKIYRRQAPGSTGTKVAAGLEAISDENEVSRLASRDSLDLLTGATDKASINNFHSATVHSRGVLTDVREGGLKRDLSTLLERTISTTDTGSEFMLYEFDDPRFPNRNNSRVPIQDLAAYYQLYDHDASWSRNRRGGVSYGSAALPNSIQVTTPNYDGGSANRTKFQGEYAGLYTQPVIAKVQFLMAIGAKEISPAEKTFVAGKVAATPYMKPMRATDTHKLLLGVMPVVTLWNPNNVPMVMDQSQILRLAHPPIAMRWKKYRGDGTEKTMHYFNLSYAMNGGQDDGLGEWYLPYTILYRFAKTSPIVFEPGEVKMFSAPSSAGGTLKQITSISEFGRKLTDPVNTWDPNAIYIMQNSCPMGWRSTTDLSPDVYDFGTSSNVTGLRSSMVFGPDDRISLEVRPEFTEGYLVNGLRDGRRVSLTSEIFGAGFNVSMTDEGFFGGFFPWNNPRTLDNFRNFQLLSRHGGIWIHRDTITPLEKQMCAFNQQLLNPSFPGGTGVIDFKSKLNAIPCGEIINASAAGDAIGLMDFSLSYGCEVGSSSQGGLSSGRRIASRPFLHSGLNVAPLMDQADKASLYDYGWDWQINSINNIEDSVVQGESATGRGFFGGGYTIESGTTHVVQREIPVIPPISIASLSHAHLGGYSLARNNNVGQNPATDNYSVLFNDNNEATNRVRYPKGVDFQQTTATGQGGLAPSVLQAIGNSYAHPNIAAGKAFVFKPRQLDGQEPAVNAPFVDHSYLANKALWDDYFFSSITPQPSGIPLYGGAGRTAQQVATDFFINDITLPNRRLSTYNSSLDSNELNKLFAEYGNYTNGFADKIASHMMVEGSFNINSTSVEAWKILFSSLKGKPSVYLGSGVTPSESSSANTVVSFGSLPTAESIVSESIDAPNSPVEQWKGGRELSDDEIEKLAIAMVEQVKLRGPFLSLSEFINRRLDGTNEELALKGALQAALDDPDVPINARFRESDRLLDNETASITFPFNAAAKGPVAYGSAAYVDQADILRGLAEQLTPRGDTFVIRTYGDALGENGEVLARAWCEAVVQRVPEYLDPADEEHVKSANLTSATNRMFGRKMIVVGFRWLNKDEI